MPGPPILTTERLQLRELTLDDAPFIFALVNEPSYIEFIGDKGVRTLDDARTYIASGPVASYEKNGFGLWLVALKSDDTPIGICGLLRRDGLDDPDIGYAFLPAYWGKGYALEAARAVLEYGRETLGMQRVVAITSLDNAASIRLLEKIGMTFAQVVRLTEGAPEVRLFATDATPGRRTASA